MTTDSPQAPAAPRPPVDLNALLKSKGQRLNLVHQAGLVQSIDEAIAQALGVHAEGLGQDALASITRAARDGIVERLKASSKAIRGLPQSDFLRDVLAARNRLMRERESLVGELTALKDQLVARRSEFEAKQQQLVQETVAAGDRMDKALADRILEVFQRMGGENANSADLQQEIVALALMGVQHERQKLLQSTVKEHESQVDTFERRISKLSKSLEDTEQELRRIAAMKGIDPGVASIYRTVQGLSMEDLQAELKKALLSNIFDANVELKNQIAANR